MGLMRKDMEMEMMMTVASNRGCIGLGQSERTAAQLGLFKLKNVAGKKQRSRGHRSEKEATKERQRS